MKKAIVDKDSCIGCGACVGILPDVFSFGDDGLAEAIEKPIKEDLEDDLMDAASGCPTDAISVEDAEN